MTNKTIAITGLSSGIGAATAALLASQGARIIGFDRNPPAVAPHAFHPLDLADSAAIDRVTAAIDEPIDILINCAGLPPTHPPERVLVVNFFALRRLTEALVPKLREGGQIVNIASLAGIGWRDNLDRVREGLAITVFEDVAPWCERRGITGASSYSASKELVIAWTVAHFDRWRARGIRMNALSPGPVDTPILPDFIATLGKRVEEDLKLNRAGTVDEIAPAIAFLCMPDARWINGANLAIDGGGEANALRQIYGL